MIIWKKKKEKKKEKEIGNKERWKKKSKVHDVNAYPTLCKTMEKFSFTKYLQQEYTRIAFASQTENGNGKIGQITTYARNMLIWI